MRPIKTILIFAIVILFASCKTETTPKNINTTNPHGIKIADSIMYIANVKNANLEDAYYMDEWLGGAKIEVLSNKIFNAVYNKKLIAYNYITGEQMPIAEVKELETEYRRDNIGYILFTEDWYFDEKKLQMHKKVNSLMLAYFRFDEDGHIIGKKAGIRVYLNGTKPMKAAQDY